MSSDIPGFYYDPVQQRYYRITSQTANSTPSARMINDRARQEQLVAKQIDLINLSKRKISNRYENKKKRLKSRWYLLYQREYGQIHSKFCHQQIRSNILSNLSSTCFLDENSSFSIANHIQSPVNYELFLTSSGYCIQLIDYKFYLTDLKRPSSIYHLQTNSIDGYRSSFYFDSTEKLMSTTLLNDENHVIIRFLDFSSSITDNSLQMLTIDPLASNYFYRETSQIIELSSSIMNLTSPLMIKCSGPCAYSKQLENFAFNINNYLYIYDYQTFQMKISLRVPIRRVTLNDIEFSNENSNLIYTTNGAQFQQWDIRQSNRLSSLRIPILCSTIKCLRTKPNSFLTSSFDERIHQFDFRQTNKPLITYDISSNLANNPHFTFAIDYQTEEFLSACSQYHLVHIWELNSGRCLNRLRCPIPSNLIHTTTKSSINSIDRIPHLAIYHPEYTRLTRFENKTSK